MFLVSVTGFEPDLLQKYNVIIAVSKDVSEGVEPLEPVLGEGPVQAPCVEVEDFEEISTCKK